MLIKSYRGLAEVGDLIKAYDYEPRFGVGDSFVVGSVVDVDSTDTQGSPAYTILVSVDVSDGVNVSNEAGSRVGKKLKVPFETMFDYEFRIVRLAKGNTPA